MPTEQRLKAAKALATRLRKQRDEARGQRNALVAGLDAEIAHRRALGQRNASMVHHTVADRLEEIRDHGLAS